MRVAGDVSSKAKEAFSIWSCTGANHGSRQIAALHCFCLAIYKAVIAPKECPATTSLSISMETPSHSKRCLVNPGLFISAIKALTSSTRISSYFLRYSALNSSTLIVLSKMTSSPVSKFFVSIPDPSIWSSAMTRSPWLANSRQK